MAHRAAAGRVARGVLPCHRAGSGVSRHPTSTCRNCSWLWGARRRPGAARLPTWPSTRPLPTHLASAWRPCCWTRVRPAEPRRSRCSIQPRSTPFSTSFLTSGSPTGPTRPRLQFGAAAPRRPRPRRRWNAPWILDSVSWPKYLAHALAFRGHLREAFAVNERLLRQPSASPWSRWFDTFHDLSLLGIVPTRWPAPPTDAPSESAAGLADEVTPRHLKGLPWWLSRGDTVALARFAALAARMARAPTTPRAALRARLLRETSVAFLDLARGDSIAAIAEAERDPRHTLPGGQLLLSEPDAGAAPGGSR